MSPPLPDDDGSSEFAFASAAKSPPARSCLTMPSAFARATAICSGVAFSGVAFGSGLMRM
jgi:hypothetical protein